MCGDVAREYANWQQVKVMSQTASGPRGPTRPPALVVLHKSNASLICGTCLLQEQKNIEQGISNTEGNGLRCQDGSPVDDEKESVRVSTGFRVFSRLFVATAQYPLQHSKFLVGHSAIPDPLLIVPTKLHRKVNLCSTARPPAPPITTGPPGDKPSRQ